MRPQGRGLLVAAAVYGVGLALTFDEFGLWVHLGGSYWQRASFDAVVVIGALLTLIAVAPEWRRFQPHHWFTAVAMALASVLFGALLVDSFRYAERLRLKYRPRRIGAAVALIPLSVLERRGVPSRPGLRRCRQGAVASIAVWAAWPSVQAARFPLGTYQPELNDTLQAPNSLARLRRAAMPPPNATERAHKRCKGGPERGR